MSNRPKISAPTPLRNKLLTSLSAGGGTDIAGNNRLARSTSTTELSRALPVHERLQNSRTPDPHGFKDSQKPIDSDEQLLNQRLKRYDLDYPEDYNEYLSKALDKSSKWYSRKTKRKLNLGNLLPYTTESHKDQAKYLSHILVHLYIAIKSLDLEGLVSISTKDLSAIKNDIELALDTDFFSADLSFDIENDDGEDDGDEEDDEVRSSGVIGKIMPRSATVISVNHWTNELKTCLKMKFDLPLTLRASLAKVYYHLALSTGQAVQTDLFIEMFVRLTFKFRTLLAEDNLLVLDHKELLDYFGQFYADPNPSFTTYSPTSNGDKEYFGAFLRLALSANYFFDPSSMREVFDWCLERCTRQTLYTSLSILAHTLPIFITEKHSVLEYIPTLFHFWSNNSANKQSVLQIIDLLGRISSRVFYQISEGKLDASKVLKTNGVFTDAQIDYIFNSLQENLRIDQKINSFHGIAKVLVYSITPKSSDHFIDKLETLLTSLQTYAHPSNSGKWSALIARFVHRFLHRYHKRYITEQEDESEVPEYFRLNESINSRIFEHFKDLVIIGAQSKRENASNYYIAAFFYLCDIPSSSKYAILNRVLIDLYDSLTDQFVNSNHRIIVALKQFQEVCTIMITDKIYRIHLTNILILLLSKIGTNDLDLNNTVINAFVTAISLIQIKDLSEKDSFVSFESTTANFIQDHLYFIKEHPNEKFDADESSVESAFVASTKAFDLIIKNFVGSYITLLEADINEKILFKLSQTALIFAQSLSEESFNYYAQTVENSLFDGELTNEGENEPLLSNLVASVIKRDPSRSKSYFTKLASLIKSEVDQGAGKTRNATSKILGADKMLILYMTVLSEVLSVSLGEVLDFKQEFLDLVNFLYKNVTNPSVQGSITYAIHKTLKNLTNIKLKENRVFQYEPPKNDFESRWGLNRDDESRLDEDNLQFDWYIPSIVEIKFAVEIFETVVIEALSKIEELSANLDSSSITVQDEIVKNLLYLSNSLSGLSILFDPDFNNDDYDQEFNRTSLEKRLLILKSLRALKGEDNELNIDIEEITKKENDDILSSTPMQESESEGGVELKSSTNLNDFNDTDSEQVDSSHIGSRVLTPTIPHESDLMSVMNPKLAFRESKIYNCLYFFGSDPSVKNQSSDYGHIHSLRSLIGQTLHKLAVRLRGDEENKIKLIQSLLLTIRVFFCDVGKESTFDLDDQLFIDYTFMKKVHSKANYTKPYTRTTLGARIEKYHRQRIILHSTNRFQTKLDKHLLKDVVDLATSAYSAIHQPAQVVLVEAIKKLIGSYSFCVNNVAELLEENIKLKDYKRVEAGLRIFRLKKIANKVIHDFNNIKRITSIFCQCLKINNMEVNDLAQRCFKDLSTSIQVPSAVVLFNHRVVDLSIRPPDKNIDLEISTVKAAKDLKREKYYFFLNEVQDYLIQEEEANTHWKTSVLHLKYLLNLQGYYELKTNSKVLEILLSKARNNHPSLVRLCVQAVNKLVNKIVSFASYDHSLENSFRVSHARVGVTTVDTSKNYSEIFDKELANFENPSYYIDSSLVNGWLFWGKEMKVLPNSPDDLPFNEEDKQILKNVGELITPDLLDSIFRTLAQENEAQGNFQSTDVELIKTIVQLGYFGVSNVTYEDILKLVVAHYDKDQKESVITACEVISGLLSATKYSTKDQILKRDEFLDGFLDTVLSSDLTPESSSVWAIMFWMVPSKVDIRRIPILLEKAIQLESFIDTESNLAFLQSTRLGFLSAIISSIGWRFADYESILNKLVFTHPYTLVRNQLGALLAALSLTFHNKQFENSDQFLLAQGDGDFGYSTLQFTEKYNSFLIDLFKTVESYRLQTVGLSPQDQLKSDYYYVAHTISRWLDVLLHGPSKTSIAPLLKDYVAPFLMNLLNNKELCKLGDLYPDTQFKRLADISIRIENIPDSLEICLAEHSAVHQLQLQLSYIEIFYSRSYLLLSTEEKQKIIEKIDSLIFNNSIEVRNAAAKVLSGIIHNSNGLKLIDHLIVKYNKIISKTKTKGTLTNEQIIKLHGSTVGVGALIGAYPYTSPPPEWLPNEISILSKASSVSGIVGKSAKDILSTFKKLRADTWHIDRESFNENQLEDLEGVLWRSYFA